MIRVKESHRVSPDFSSTSCYFVVIGGQEIEHTQYAGSVLRVMGWGEEEEMKREEGRRGQRHGVGWVGERKHCFAWGSMI